MSESRTIRHTSLPVEAPEAFWRALGWQTYTNSDQTGSHPVYEMDQLLALAVAAGARGEQALGQAVAEHQRRSEEKTRATAIAREAEAIAKLAESIRSEADESVLERIMSRLSERTRYAIRQQLAGTGLLPRQS